MNLIEFLKKDLSGNESKNALTYLKDFKVVQKISYAELYEKINTISNTFKSQNLTGFVLFCVDDPFDFVIHFLSLIHSGIVPVPIAAPQLGQKNIFQKKLDSLFENYCFDFIFTDSNLAEEFKKYKRSVLTPNHLSISNFQRLSKNFHPKACFIQFSSGSTAEPKGIVIEHDKLITNIEQILENLNLTLNEKIISWLPLSHDMGIIGGVLSALASKTDCTLMHPKDYILGLDQFIDYISHHKMTFLLGPDFMYRQIARGLENRSEKLDLSSLKICMSGSELVLPSTIEIFSKALAQHGQRNAVFMPVYGMAEACLGVCFSKPQLLSGFKNVSCGQPLKQIEMCIFDENGNPVFQEQVIGEIGLRGPNFFEEYFENKFKPVKSKDGYYLTGDEGYIFSNEIFPLGRKKNVIISNGQKIHSVDLEAHLFEKLNHYVKRNACVQIDEVYVVAEIELIHFFKTKKIKSMIRKTIAERVPVLDKNIFLIPKFNLPRTTSGKLQRYKVIENIKSKIYDEPFYFIKKAYKTYIKQEI